MKVLQEIDGGQARRLDVHETLGRFLGVIDRLIHSVPAQSRGDGPGEERQVQFPAHSVEQERQPVFFMCLDTNDGMARLDQKAKIIHGRAVCRRAISGKTLWHPSRLYAFDVDSFFRLRAQRRQQCKGPPPAEASFCSYRPHTTENVRKICKASRNPRGLRTVRSIWIGRRPGVFALVALQTERSAPTLRQIEPSFSWSGIAANKQICLAFSSYPWRLRGESASHHGPRRRKERQEFRQAEFFPGEKGFSA